MLDIGYAGALLGGVATLVSPCSVMLLPAFFAYAFGSRTALLGRTLLFYLGLITTLVPLGAAAGTVGVLFAEHRGTFVTVSALIVIALGLVQALGVVVPLPGFTRSRGDNPTSGLSLYLLGTVYGVAGTCAGPILGSVLAVAAIGDAVRGGLLLAIFAVGMVVPLVVLALLWDVLDLGNRPWLQPRPVTLGPIRTTVVNLVGGALFVGLGVLLLLTDGLGAVGGLLGAEQQQSLESALLRGDRGGLTDLLTVVLLFAGSAGLVAIARWLQRRSTT